MAVEAAADLHVPEVARAIVGADAPGGRMAERERFALGVLSELLPDASVIEYRQAVLADLFDHAQASGRARSGATGASSG